MNSIVTRHDYILDLLEDLINQPHRSQAELLICSTKEEFVSQVFAELDQLHVQDQPGPAAPQEESNVGYEERTTLGPSHALLSRTLQILSASQHIRLIFCPTLTVVRGYLSGYMIGFANSPQPLGSLFILNLVALHYGTSAFTLQGLSQTLATAVSAARRASRALQLVECKDITDPSNLNRGSTLWQAEVQLLSAAIKIGQAGQNWGRRTISVEKIASRWFQTEDG